MRSVRASIHSERRVSSVLGYAGIAASLCFLASELGKTFFLGRDFLPAFSLEGGVLLAALLLVHGWAWPRLWIGSFLGDLGSHILHGRAFAPAAGFSLATVLSALTAAILIRYAAPTFSRLAVRPRLMDSPMESPSRAAQSGADPGGAGLIDSIFGVAFLFTAAMVGAAAGAAVAAAVQGLLEPQGAGFNAFLSRLTSEMLGMTAVAPLLVSWRRVPSEIGIFVKRRSLLTQLHMARLTEALGVGAVLALGACIASKTRTDSLYVRDYLVIPLAVWSALRFGSRGASLANLAATVTYLLSSPLPPAQAASHGSLDVLAAFDLQSFLNVVSIMSLFLAAGLSERARKAQELRSALADKELLLKEIEHRVKNNLSVVISVLNIGRSDSEDGAAAKVLMEAETRIRSMALIYERLYDSKSLAHVEIGDYVGRLGAQLLEAYAISTGVALEVESEEIHLDMRRAVPLGLILNELISNAPKHAFPHVTGRIMICLRGSEGRISVRVRDDGAGLPSGFQPDVSGGMGFKLVRMLAAEILAVWGTREASALPGLDGVAEALPTTTPAGRTLLYLAMHRSFPAACCASFPRWPSQRIPRRWRELSRRRAP